MTLVYCKHNLSRRNCSLFI